MKCADLNNDNSLDLCDVCGREDGWQGMNMQKCEGCGVCVHETCYGITNYSEEGRKFSKWRCGPCEAIGLEIKVSKPSKPKRTISIKSRCTECALCSVNTGAHAMHLLYDTHGEDGTPVILSPNKRKGLEERVAWVHTLCALFIGDHQKIVFGCKKDGTCLSENNEEEEDDYEEESNSSNDRSLFDSDGKALIALNNPHHFVVASAYGTCEWSRAVRNLKETPYKCLICGKANSLKQHTLAIPCCHRDCTQSFHVGCARWGKSSDQYERIKFNPGSFNEIEEDYDPATARGYCNIHAKRRKCNGFNTKKRKLQKEELRHLQGMSSCRNVKKLKKSHIRKEGKTICNSKPVVHICPTANEEKELLISYDRGAVVTDEDIEDHRWSHLWVPNYRPDSENFFEWDMTQEISQADVGSW